MLISLVLMQPDLGMTILISATFFCQLFIAGLPILLVIYGLIFILAVSIFAYYFLDHVKNRIDSFLGNADSYQIDLSLLAFKSGGILGKGPGQGDLKEKIPDANTDFIFAVAGEELGLIFCLIILIIILSIVALWMCFINSRSGCIYFEKGVKITKFHTSFAWNI